MTRPTFEFQGMPANYAHPDTVPLETDAQETVPTLQVDETQVSLRTAVADEVWLVRFGATLRGMFDRIAAEWRQAKLAITVAFAAGVLVGLPILGWWLWPVEWTGGSYVDLSPKYQQAAIDMAAELSAYDPANPAVARFAYLYPGVEFAACDQARAALDPSKQQQLRFLTYKVTGSDCSPTVVE
jgi:hypothetical protein